MLKRTLGFSIVALTVSFTPQPVQGQASGQDTRIPAGARVFIQPMDGFETFLAAAIAKKKVAVVVVDHRDQADFEIAGRRTIVLCRSDEQVSIAVRNIKTDVIGFGYRHDMQNSRRGKQRVAESWAKQLKDWIERGQRA